MTHSADISSRPAVLRYFLEYQWFVDFAVYATAVYVFTEGYSCVVEPQREMNLGVLWCLLTVFFSMYPCACCCSFCSFSFIIIIFFCNEMPFGVEDEN